MNPTQCGFVSAISVRVGILTTALRQHVPVVQETHMAFSVTKNGKYAEVEDIWTSTYLQTTFAISNKAAAETQCIRDMAKADHPPSTFW
jgi:hypothetical protein